MKTKRAFLVEPRKIEIREIDLPMKDNQIMIKVASSGLCTWELNFWKGILRTDCYPYSLGHELPALLWKWARTLLTSRLATR